MFNASDFLIIYLTCAAPLGVLHFLQHRQDRNRGRLWLKTFFTFIFWLPFAFRLLLENKSNKKFFALKNIFSKNEKEEAQIFLFKKQAEEILGKSNLPVSIFEFREIIDRYVGLTLAKSCANEKATEPEKEFFRIANGRDGEVGAICLNRRNLKRLKFHQTQARQDFFQIIRQLVKFASDKADFVESAAGFFRLLNDTESQSAIEKALFDTLPNKRNFTLNGSENFLWNTELCQAPAAKSTPPQLQTLTATANSSAKD